MSETQEKMLELNKKRVTFKGNRYKIQCYVLGDDRFKLYAELLTPKTPEEAKFCLWDLWESDSEDTYRFLERLNKMVTKNHLPRRDRVRQDDEPDPVDTRNYGAEPDFDMDCGIPGE